jgi:hypothetical protein
MTVLYFILFLLALICFIAAAAGATLHPRLDIIALGLAFWVLVFVIRAAQAL